MSTGWQKRIGNVHSRRPPAPRRGRSRQGAADRENTLMLPRRTLTDQILSSAVSIHVWTLRGHAPRLVSLVGNKSRLPDAGRVEHRIRCVWLPGLAELRGPRGEAALSDSLVPSGVSSGRGRLVGLGLSTQLRFLNFTQPFKELRNKR